MIALVIILILIAVLVPLMVRNARIRSQAQAIRAREAAKGNHLSRKTSYLAAKAERRARK
jgi:type II secretory pathway pseudopilin PulG